MKKWKILFWVALALFLNEAVGLPFSDDIGLYDFIGLSVGGFSLFPLYGYSYQVAIGSKFIAIGIFLYNLVTSVVLWGYVTYYSFDESELFVYIIFAVFFTLSVLVLIPQFRYAFRSNQLWRLNA